MTNEKFNEIVEAQCESIKRVLSGKSKEYASEDDRLHNFKLSARRQECTPERALWGMRDKHEVSIQDIISRIEFGFGYGNLTKEMIDEKIGDDINYLILLKALLYERCGY